MDWLKNLEPVHLEDIRQGDTLAFKMFAGYTIVDIVGEVRDGVVYNEKGQKIGKFPNIQQVFYFELVSDLEVSTRVSVAQLALDLGREEVADDILDSLLDLGVWNE